MNRVMDFSLSLGPKKKREKDLSRELAQQLYSDLKLARKLQLNEALAASVKTSSVRQEKKPVRRQDDAQASMREMDRRNLQRREHEVRDKEMARKRQQSRQDEELARRMSKSWGFQEPFMAPTLGDGRGKAKAETSKVAKRREQEVRDKEMAWKKQQSRQDEELARRISKNWKFEEPFMPPTLRDGYGKAKAETIKVGKARQMEHGVQDEELARRTSKDWGSVPTLRHGNGKAEAETSRAGKVRQMEQGLQDEKFVRKTSKDWGSVPIVRNGNGKAEAETSRAGKARQMEQGLQDDELERMISKTWDSEKPFMAPTLGNGNGKAKAKIAEVGPISFEEGELARRMSKNWEFEESFTAATLVDGNGRAKAKITKVGKDNLTCFENTPAVKMFSVICPICFEDTPWIKMFHVTGCSHKFCLDCLSHHVEVQVKENRVPVKCPMDCSEHLEFDQCQSFLPLEVLDLFARRLTESTVPQADRVYCPFPNCSAFMSKGEMNLPLMGSSSIHPHRTSIGVCDCPFPNCSAFMSKGEMNLSVMGSSSRHPHRASIGACECLECHRLFCVECKVPWHRDLSCAEYQRLPPGERDVEDLKLHELAKSKKWQRCRKCQSMIELARGCYHMKCRCGHEFCYTCGKEWKNKQPTCKCKLWDVNNLVNGR